MRGETKTPSFLRLQKEDFNPLPSCEGRRVCDEVDLERGVFQSAPLIRGETRRIGRIHRADDISIHSPHTRGDEGEKNEHRDQCISIHSPHTRGDELLVRFFCVIQISIHSPLTRGDSISRQKSIRIYVSLHNKTMIHRFSGLYKPLFAAQSPIFGVRSPWESHDSFTFARPSAGRGITP